VRLRLSFSMLALTLAVAVATATVATGAPAGPAPTGTPVPRGFVGVDVDGPLFTAGDHVDVARQLDLMVASGVESVRVAFNWAAAQPYRSWADVPTAQASSFQSGSNNVPTSFNASDQIVGLAAQRGLVVLPTILYAPQWDAGENHDGGLPPPARTGPYADYLTALVDRYGRYGTYWASHPSVPRLPVRTWQIWNEPNLSAYWPQPFARSYVALLRAAHGAIKRADPGAQIVLGALTNAAWKYLGQIYRISGARGLFDVIAVNGFTSTPANVILYLELVRRAARHEGDGHKPLLATELSWPSALGRSPQHFDWSTTEAGQARNIAQLLPMLAANRKQLGLLGFDYFTWIGEEHRRAPAFNFAGLVRYQLGGRIIAKPALAAFRRAALAIEGCRRKGAVAGRCITHTP
jgi:hypothetical protein